MCFKWVICGGQVEVVLQNIFEEYVYRYQAIQTYISVILILNISELINTYPIIFHYNANQLLDADNVVVVLL